MPTNVDNPDAVVAMGARIQIAHPLDVALGERIRRRRREVGISQSELARRLGITFQQVQKYEHATNRVSFSRLVDIVQALNCSVADIVGDIDKAS
jgi:transcriptional regulator with XRE-family HTH domain